MNREDALKKSEEGLKQLAEDLKNGQSDTLVQYLEMLSKFHRYSFGNCIMIAMQMPEATLVAGFGHWKKMGRFVKKGEKGIAIFAPLVGKRTVENEKGDSEDAKCVFGFRVVHVFDLSQTEGKKLPEFGTFTGDPGTKLHDLELLVKDKGIELVYDAIPGGALGVSEGGKVTVLPQLEDAEKFGVLVHELAHELLHRGDRRQETTKTIRETEAEAVAYVVSRAVGLDCSTKSSDYIQLWSGDVEVLMQSLELVRDVSTNIITELEQISSNEVQQVA